MTAPTLPFHRYTPRAGHPDWASLFPKARELAAELTTTLERPQTGFARWRRRLAAYRTAGSNYFINRRLHRQGREDLRPLYFIWTTLRACNFACTYCDDHQGQKYPDLPSRGVLDTARGKDLLRIMRTRTPSVYFAGGEPTARRDLPELTREARDLDYYPIVVNTNASLIARNLSKPGWRTWLADTDLIVVSLDALDLGVLRDMWVYKSPEDVLLSLLVLRELRDLMGFKLLVNVVIQPGQVDLAREVLDLAEDLDLWFTPVPMNVGPRVHEGLRQDPAYQALADHILARKAAGALVTGSARLNRRLLRSEPLMCRNTLKPHIDFDGTLAWPCKASVNVAPERISVLDFDHVDALYDHARERMSPDGFHGPGPEQCGADCNWAQNYSTDAYAHGLAHPMSLLGEVAEFAA